MTKEQVVLALPEIEVDDQGRIWRVALRHGRGVKMGGGYDRGTRLSPCHRKRAEHTQSQGYLQLFLMIDGKRLSLMAHRVVWVKLRGPIPLGLTINHKNGIKNDNQPANLELATYSEQRRHALDVLNVRRHHPVGSKHPKTHLTEQDVLRMREMRAAGARVKDIAAAYAMRPTAVSAICCRINWRHV